MRPIVAVIAVVVFVSSLTRVSSAVDDISQAYAGVKPALVKIWAFDASGLPRDSGTGFVVKSDQQHSWILTALHVVEGAREVSVDGGYAFHDLPATVTAVTSARSDLALLLVDRGNLNPVQFVPRNRTLIEGKFVATAGFFKFDQGTAQFGEVPRLVGPGTIGALPSAGRVIEVNLDFEPGLSGAPVFDSASGDVVGVADTMTDVGKAGYAISALPTVLDFLKDNRIAAGGDVLPPTPAPTVQPASPVPVPVPTPAPVPAIVRTPSPAPVVALAPPPAPVVSRTAPPAAAVVTAPPVFVRTAVNACFGRTRAPLDATIASCSSLIAAGTASNETLAFLYDQRALAYRKNLQFNLAISDADRALRINPDDAIAYTTRGYVYTQTKEYGRALADARQAMRINPNSADAYILLGKVYERSKVPDLAIAAYQHAALLDPNAATRIQIHSKVYNP